MYVVPLIYGALRAVKREYRPVKDTDVPDADVGVATKKRPQYPTPNLLMLVQLRLILVE